MIDMSNDSDLFRTRVRLEAGGWTLDGNAFHRGDETILPLCGAKMVHHFDHRWATYDGDDVRDVTEAEHADPDVTVLPRYWVPEAEVAGRWRHDWLLGFRNVCRATDERTVICSTFPLSGVGNSMPLVVCSSPAQLLAAALTSIAADFVVRQKLGGTNLNFFYVEQLPVPRPGTFAERCPWTPAQSLQDWIEDRVDKLVFTAWDMAPAALVLGDDSPPFVWNPNRRAVPRAELDAAILHPYGIDRDDVDYILGTFPIGNRNDLKVHGEERTRRLVLDAYDRIAAAVATSEPFVATLDPPPGDGPRHQEPT